jgi:hypothetical protein
MGPKGWNPRPTWNGLWLSGTMEIPIVTVLDIGETLVPCMWIIRIV